MPYIEMFSPAMIALQEELTSGYHPTLQRVLALCEDRETWFSALATHAEILVDDAFNQRKLDDLCDDILTYLKDHREHRDHTSSPIVLLN